MARRQSSPCHLPGERVEALYNGKWYGCTVVRMRATDADVAVDGGEWTVEVATPIDFAFAAVAQIALPTAIRFDRSWASRYALTLPCLKTYPKGFLRLARAIAPAHQAPFFSATSHAAKTQIPPAYANEAPARKTLRAPGRGGQGQGASNEPL